MDAPPAESRTFLHRVLRCIAILAIAYGLVQAISLIFFAVVRGLPYERFYLRSEKLAVAMSALLIASTVLVLVGGWALLRWRAWGRSVLIVWATFAIVLSFAQAIASAAFYVRELGGSTQPYRPHAGLYVWSSFANWLTGNALPVVCLAVLLQPEVARLWAGPRGGGGFDVIPMANATPTEVVQ
jgi:hypothetical protein